MVAVGYVQGWLLNAFCLLVSWEMRWASGHSREAIGFPVIKMRDPEPGADEWDLCIENIKEKGRGKYCEYNANVLQNVKKYICLAIINVKNSAA